MVTAKWRYSGRISQERQDDDCSHRRQSNQQAGDDDGRWRAISLYRAEDEGELNAILESLPLYPWMTISVRALAPHPNDPGLRVPKQTTQIVKETRCHA